MKLLSDSKANGSKQSMRLKTSSVGGRNGAYSAVTYAVHINPHGANQ